MYLLTVSLKLPWWSEMYKKMEVNERLLLIIVLSLLKVHFLILLCKRALDISPCCIFSASVQLLCTRLSVIFCQTEATSHSWLKKKMKKKKLCFYWSELSRDMFCSPSKAVVNQANHLSSQCLLFFSYFSYFNTVFILDLSSFFSLKWAACSFPGLAEL